MFNLAEGEHVTNGKETIYGPQVVRVFEYPGNLIAVQGIIDRLTEGKMEMNGTEDTFESLVESN